MTRPAGLILAGGRGSRMGDGPAKPLRPLAGRTLLDHVVSRLRPQVGALALNAQEPSAFEPYGLRVVPDRHAGFAGPLAGIEAGLADLSAIESQATHLLVVPADTPFLPADLAARLLERASPQPRIAAFQGRLQPTVGLWPRTVLPALTAWIDVGELAAMKACLSAIGHITVPFEDDLAAPGGDPFFNVNTPEDLAFCEAWLLPN